MPQLQPTWASRAAMPLALMLAAGAGSAQDLSLDGKTIGVAVVGTQHFWDREAFRGATEAVERLGGTVLPTDGGRDNQVHADNHDVFLTSGVDAVITILGDASPRSIPSSRRWRLQASPSSPSTT